MRLARDELGVRWFQQEEVQTGQQITGFISRLAAKKRLVPSRVNHEDLDGEVPGEGNRSA